MITKQDMFIADNEKLPELSQTALIDQIKWLIKLRWFAVAGIIVAGIVCTTVFHVLPSTGYLHVCAGILLACNLVYLSIVSRRGGKPTFGDSIHTLIQIEIDLLILTAVIHFGGGIVNPFILFYAFHIIIATIILTKTLSFVVSISAIVMFGVMAIGEFEGWPWLEHYPLNLATQASLWKNPIYMFGAFFAFTATVVLTQYLTRTVVARMTSKEIEAARNRDLLEAIITAMGEGLLFINNEGKVTISNPEADKWTNDKKEILSNFPGPLVKHVTELMAQQGNGHPNDGSIKFDIKEPHDAYIEAKSCPVIGNDGARLGYVIVGQNLTEHKKLERDLRMRTEETSQINEMLKMSRVEMAQREKMVAIGQMATGIAHEIGNPLASLSSLLQYLGRKIKDEKQIEQFDLMGKQIERISVILRRMLSLSRPATSEYKWVDLNNTIDNTLALVRFDKRAQSVEIINTENPQLPMIWLNPLHFEQVLLNVVINALDAMTARKTDDKHSLKVTRTFENGMIEVRISDTGIGMDQAICKRAFESFFTTKELGKGTGLGLFISYNLITEIDGTISMDSEPGKGTTVIIRIPVRPKKHLIGDSEEDVAAVISE